MNVDRLREELFLVMTRSHGGTLAELSSEDAALLGEHAARIAKAALDGMGYFDRTGQVRNPSSPRAHPGERAAKS